MKEKRELIILGMGATRKLCPFDDGAEVWSVNTGYQQIAEMGGHMNKIFLSHPQHQRVDGKGDAYSFDQFNMMAEHDIEIINIHRCKGLKHKLYPYKRINEKFKADGFFSNSICYMVAYALDQDAKKSPNGSLAPLELKYPMRIRFYGVDMLTIDEYEWEKGGLEYWIGKAEGLGVEIEICEGSTVKTTVTGKPYGFKFFNLYDIDPFNTLSRRDRKKGDYSVTVGSREKMEKDDPLGLVNKIKKLSKKGLVDLVDGKGELIDPKTLETYN